MPIRRISSGGPYEGQAGYCRAVVAGGWVHVAGTTCRPDPKTGVLPSNTLDQCKGAMQIVEAALTEAGASVADVVRVTYMVRDATTFDACLPFLRQTFGAAPPAATMVECGLVDADLLIEIEVTAWIGDR